MSGVEELHPPADESPGEEEGEKESEEESDDKSKDSSSTSADSETTSLTGSGNWTILEKEEVEDLKVTASSEPSPITSSPQESETSKGKNVDFSHGIAVEDILPASSSIAEDDSESIETISDDESLVSASLSESLHANLASFCYIPDSTDSGFTGSGEINSQQISTVSLLSLLSNQSVISDGIPIVDNNSSPLEEDGQAQYEWNNMEGAREVEDDSLVELPPENEEVEDQEDLEDQEVQEEEINDQSIEQDEAESDDNTNDDNSERRARGEDSEPGYDLDDDGLPGAPLPPLNQEVELYPSQELDENFQVIERGKVYKHEHNLKLDHILTAVLVLALALVVGLGIGHFLGLILSVVTDIPSSILGLGPDPLAGPNFGLGVNPAEELVDRLNSDSEADQKEDEQTSETIGLDIGLEGQEDAPNPVPFSIFGTIKNMFVRLGTKFGYIKKSEERFENTVEPLNTEETATEEETFLEYQCMTADDRPIMVNYKPVMVKNPEDCQMYFVKGKLHIEPPAQFMEVAQTVFRSDDQDLDDRVIRQLWDENKELRDQVQVMKATIGDPGDEAMAAILRDKINELLTANADLQREVVRLRYADAAREAAESVETLDKLRKTRDTLNDIVTENDQLKLEVAKARYGEPPVDRNSKAERDSLVEENKDLKQELKILKNSFENAETSEFESASKNPHPFDIDDDIMLNNPLKKDDLNTPWASRRHEELKIDEGLEKEEIASADETSEDEAYDEDDEAYDEDDDEEEIKNESMNNLSKYLSSLLKMFGVKIVSKDGSIDWDQAKNFMDGLKVDLTSKFDEAGNVAKEEINIIINKFEDLRNFVDAGNVKENMEVTQKAAKKLFKSLVDAVDDLKDASEDAAEKSDWFKIFQWEATKMKSSLENRWTQIKEKWQIITENGDNAKNDKEKSYNRDANHAEKEDKYERKKSRKVKVAYGTEDEEDEGYQSSGDVKRNKKEEKETHKKQDSHNKYEDKRQKERTKYERKEDDEGKRTFRTDKDKRHRSSGERDGYQMKERSHKRGEQRKVNQENRHQFGSRHPTGEDIKNKDWLLKSGEEREKNRQEDGHSDWIFERAKYRKDIRNEESRGDWYFEKKGSKDDKENQEYPQSRRNPCEKDDWDCHYSLGHKYTEFGRKEGKKRGEKNPIGDTDTYSKKEQETGRSREKKRGDKNKKDFGDFSHFKNEVKFAERHYQRGNNQYKRSHDRRKVLKNDAEDWEMRYGGDFDENGNKMGCDGWA